MEQMNKNLGYYSSKYLETFSKTKSLNKLEKEAKENNDYRLKYPLSAYLYHSKLEHVSKFKHKTLYVFMNEYSSALKEKDKNNKYFKTYFSLCSMANEKENDKNFKRDVSKKVKDFLNSENLSLLFFVKDLDLKYSNAYNFLFNDDLSSLSRKKTLFLLDKLKEFKND